MAEKALTIYDDDMMDVMTKVLMLMFGVMVLMAILPVTQQAQAQTYAQAYLGVNDPRTIKATDKLQWIDLVENQPYIPWISAYFIQDGPHPVEIAINHPDDRFTMNPGETVTINRSGAQERIRIIFYVCQKGKRATVRITGEY